MVCGEGLPHTDPDVLGDMTILIVEDNHEMRRIIKAIVGDLAHRIEERGDGREALAAYRECRPDWVLMDVRLPGINGPEAARRILAERPRTRIILMSTYEPADLPGDLDQCGAERFLRKQDIDAAALLS